MGLHDAPAFWHPHPYLTLPAMRDYPSHVPLKLKCDACEISTEGRYIHPRHCARKVGSWTALAKCFKLRWAVKIFRRAQAHYLLAVPEHVYPRVHIISDQRRLILRIKSRKLSHNIGIVNRHKAKTTFYPAKCSC